MEMIDLKSLALRLSERRAYIIRRFPFFGRLMLNLSFAFSNCRTAYTDMQRIVFDPEFLMRLTDDEVDFVLMHELLHCAFKHCLLSGGKNHLIYNIACDIVVNSHILDATQLDTMTIDSMPVMHLAPNGREGRLYSAEQIYKMLIKDMKGDNGAIQIIIGNNMDSSVSADKKGEGGNPDSSLPKDNESNGIEDEPNSSSTEDNCNNGIEDEPNSSSTEDDCSNNIKDEYVFDNHDNWDKIANPDRLNSEWDSNLVVCCNACEKSQIPKSIERILDDLIFSDKIDWKHLLHSYIQCDRNDYTLSIPDRRYTDDIIMPSFQVTDGAKVENIWFLVDTSGSISDKQLTETYGEILNSLEQFDHLSGLISFFDTKVTEPVPFDSIEQLRKIKPVGGGGTSFRAIFKALKEYFEEDMPCLIIILTDGYSFFPDQSEALGVDVIWIITNSPCDAPWGECIHINSTEEEPF